MLMDGLEAVELRLSNVCLDNDTKRIDAEYFNKLYLNYSKLLKQKSLRLNDFLLDGRYGILPDSSDYIENGVPLIRGVDIRCSSINIDSLVKVPINYYQDKYSIYKNDILILVKGATIDYSDGVLLINDDIIGKMIFNGSVFRIRVQNIVPAYLYSFMTTKYFTYQKKLAVVNNGIEYNSINSIKNFYIPNLSINFQQQIEKTVKLAHQKLEQSKQEYQGAEKLLLDELGLTDFKPSNENISIRKLSDSFGESGRLDSEYYQPKYSELLQMLKVSTNGCDKLDVFIRGYSTGYPYKSETYLEYSGVPLIRINNINNGNLDTSNATYIPDIDILLSPKDVAVEGDILISMSGTIGNSCKIPAGIKAVINQRIMRITPKNYDSDVLSLVINSVIGKTQLNRIGTGGVQTNISSTDIKNIMIPILSDLVQNNISNKIQNSFNLKQQSEQLLELAKHAVEVAIEQDEQTAIKLFSDVQNV